MNKKILQKCVDELGKESPSIEYIKGMLETLIEMDSTVLPTPTIDGITRIPYVKELPVSTTVEVDEEFNETAAKYVGGAIGKIG